MTLQRLGNQIASLFQLMNERGYDGHFLCNSGHPGKLTESVNGHLLDVLQGRTSVPSFFLTTYSHWKDEQSPYVRCDFKISHDQSEGFRVEKMDITSGTDTGKIKSVTLQLKSNLDLPYCAQANKMVLVSDRKCKIR